MKSWSLWPVWVSWCGLPLSPGLGPLFFYLWFWWNRTDGAVTLPTMQNNVKHMLMISSIFISLVHKVIKSHTLTWNILTIPTWSLFKIFSLDSFMREWEISTDFLENLHSHISIYSSGRRWICLWITGWCLNYFLVVCCDANADIFAFGLPP